jgi:hypothetical protein
MKTAARSLLALGVVAALAATTYSYWPRSAGDADRAERRPEALANTATGADSKHGEPGGFSERDTPADGGATRAAAVSRATAGPEATAAAREVPRRTEAPPIAELVSEQSPSPFVREVVRSFGDYVPTTGPLHDKLEEFAAGTPDPISATTLEPSLLSAIARSNTPVVDRRVECTTTACGMLLVYPLGTDTTEVRDQVEQLAPSLGGRRGETMAIYWPRADGAPSALVIYRLLPESTPQSVVAQSAFR